MNEAEVVLNNLKTSLMNEPTLPNPRLGEPLTMYLTAG